MLSSTSKVVIATMLCGTLSACSDGGSDSTFDEYQDEADGLVTQITPLDFTDPSTLPVAGSAEYDGFMAIGVDAELIEPADIDSLASDAPEALLMGDLELDVSFDDDAVSGNVTNIVNGNNDRYQGSLNIGGSEDDYAYFDREADVQEFYTYGASLTGSVTDPDGNDWDVDAQMDGDFLGGTLGAIPTYTAGDVIGGACSTDLETCSELEGIYGARR